MENLKHVNIVDLHGKAYHVFKDTDGSSFQVECTKAEYLALGNVNAGQPFVKGAIWDYSYTIPKLDTISGLLEDNTYYVSGEEVAVRLTGKQTRFIDKTKFLVDASTIEERTQLVSTTKAFPMDVEIIPIVNKILTIEHK